MTSFGLKPFNIDTRCSQVNVTKYIYERDHHLHTCHMRPTYSLALFWAFFRIGSILVAFMTSPLTFSFPLMYSFCAFALPEMSLEN
jgi:hypothetical protein